MLDRENGIYKQINDQRAKGENYHKKACTMMKVLSVSFKCPYFIYVPVAL